MNQKEIVKNNKIIAEFMGGSYTSKLFDIPKNYIWLPFHNLTPIAYLKYHISYDWIMPVVEKIEELDVVASFQIEQPTIYIWKSSEESTFEDIQVDIFNKTKLEAVYEAIVKFMDWYNLNQK
jgi:hypothetical protein